MVLMLHSMTYGAEIYQGYFSTTFEIKQHEQKYKVLTGYNTVDTLDEEGKPTGKTKQEAIYEEKIDKWTTTRPKLGAGNLRDYQIVGEYGGEKLIYVITSDEAKWEILNKRLEYLGASIQEIAQKSLKDSAYLPIAQRLMYSSWYTGNKDEHDNLIPKRGNMAQWIADGKPKLLDRWYPKVVYAGVPCPMPTQTATEGKSEIDQLIEVK